jgi:low affinity Fe/Cu permease
MNKVFRRFAERISITAGTPWAFVAAVAVLIGWAVSGPFFGFSEHWQLVINSFTTIVTFLMVFIIQNTQNRDFKALHLKLDELIRATEGAHRGLIMVQDLSDEQLHRLEKAFHRIRRQAGSSDDVIDEIASSLENSPPGGRSKN